MKILNTNKDSATVRFEDYEIGYLKAILISLEQLMNQNIPITSLVNKTEDYFQYVDILHLIHNYRDKFIHIQELIKEANDNN